jgi:hypothetical protein
MRARSGNTQRRQTEVPSAWWPRHAEERCIANGTAKREPSRPAAVGESGHGSRARGKLRNANCRGSAPGWDFDLRHLQDPDTSLVHLVNNVAEIAAGAVHSETRAPEAQSGAVRP